MKLPLAARVWDTLSQINVNEHVEKKGNLSYLSWAWAWQTLMEKYPASVYEFKPPVFFEDGSCEVWCTVTITEGEEAMFREMWLPVMDNRNNAVKFPDARQISDTRMRCLVKCLAMAGLAHYLFAGEDLPANAPSYSEEQKQAFDNFLTGSALGLAMFRRRVGDDIYTDLYNSFESDKTKNKKLAEDQEKIGIDIFNGILEKLQEEDTLGVKELLEDETNTVVALVKSQLTGPQRKTLEFMLTEEAA